LCFRAPRFDREKKEKNNQIKIITRIELKIERDTGNGILPASIDFYYDPYQSIYLPTP